MNSATKYHCPVPNEFFRRLFEEKTSNPKLSVICAGFERGKWRSEALAQHLLEWLPEFALSHSEISAITPQNVVRLLREAATTIYTSAKYQKRGEVGELILHACVRQLFNTLPAISKIYFKDSTNSTVKGFDCVQVCPGPEGLELWLGECKFYKNISRAINDVIKEISEHCQDDYLRKEFILIQHKIDASWPYADELKMLLSTESSLDDVFKKAVIPVLLTYESNTTGSATAEDASYIQKITQEALAHHANFINKMAGLSVEIALILFPMRVKDELVSEMDKRLKGIQ